MIRRSFLMSVLFLSTSSSLMAIAQRKDVHFYEKGKLIKTVFANGEVRLYKNGQLHCEDGPAVISPNGSKTWYYHGDLHRIDGGPVCQYADGGEDYFHFGVLYKSVSSTGKVINIP